MVIKDLSNRVLKKLAKPCIIFESIPDFSDNTRPVFDELVRRGYDKKYNFFWYIAEEEYACLKNGEPEYWKKWDFSSLKNRMRNLSLLKEVKAVIVCNRFIIPYPFDKFDKSFYLSHGVLMKDLRNQYTIPNEFDYCISTSEEARTILAYSLDYDFDRIIPLGYPRNDVFRFEKIDVKKILNTKCNKVIVWYPTYRQHKGGIKAGGCHSLPIIHDEDTAKEINEFLKIKNILVVIKPHFVQDMSYITKLSLSNLIFIDDHFFVKNEITSYQFLADCDALLSDYSSVYTDFLLCDKPIGLIWEDIEEYKKSPGLYPEYEKYTEGAVKIYNKNELLDFLREVADDLDPLRDKRSRLRDILHIANDGQSTKRVVDFIIKEAEL